MIMSFICYYRYHICTCCYGPTIYCPYLVVAGYVVAVQERADASHNPAEGVVVHRLVVLAVEHRNQGQHLELVDLQEH